MMKCIRVYKYRELQNFRWILGFATSGPGNNLISDALANQLHLENVALATDHLVEHRVNEESEEQPGNQTSDHHDGKWFLRVAPYPCGHRSGEQAQASD